MGVLDAPYIPPPTVSKFAQDDSLIRVIVGPLGSGKSLGCIMELLKRAAQQKPHKGVRYTRFAIIRNTLQQLRQTVLADIREHLGDVMNYYSTDSTVQLRFDLPDGTKIYSDWMLLPLDTKEDVRRLLSLQLTGAWINELREIPIEIIRPLLGRTGRYPSKANGWYTWRGIIADTNPWDTDSEYHKRLVLEPNPYWKLFHQPSGIGPQAENRDNLAPDYYEVMMDERESDFVAVHVESMWGSSNAGQAVFRRSFNAPVHARDIQMITNPHKPLLVGMDFGRTPTALICQTDNFGRLIVFKEVLSEDMGLVQMVNEKLLPTLNSPPFAGRSVFIVADPAGNHKNEIRDETCFTTLRDAGLAAYTASTNDISKRLMAVERLLMKYPAGEPGLQISKEGCPTLIMALGNKYRYRKKRDGQLEDLPEKLHPWSDLADSLQYACLGVQQNLVAKVIARSNSRPRRAPMPAAAWT
jgi:hypothetical protein